jgi:Rv2632c-like
MPMADQNWRVSLAFTEEDTRTRADATLELAGRRFHGVGRAKRAPGDPIVPAIGLELAAARALSNLSHQLLDAAAGRIETLEGHPVKVHG